MQLVTKRSSRQAGSSSVTAPPRSESWPYDPDSVGPVIRRSVLRREGGWGRPEGQFGAWRRIDGNLQLLREGRHNRTASELKFLEPQLFRITESKQFPEWRRRVHQLGGLGQQRDAVSGDGFELMLQVNLDVPATAWGSVTSLRRLV